jgi:cysteine synthase
MQAVNITPAEARAQLNWLRGCNEVGTEARKSELRAVLAAADEVEETDPAKMIAFAERLESWAAHYDTQGREFQATENREAAARFRRCAARALGLRAAA